MFMVSVFLDFVVMLLIYLQLCLVNLLVFLYPMIGVCIL